MWARHSSSRLFRARPIRTASMPSGARVPRLVIPCLRRKVAEGKLFWPNARVLVRENFRHDFTDVARDYGYIETGLGNLFRNHPVDRYSVVGVCISGLENVRSNEEAYAVTLR